MKGGVIKQYSRKVLNILNAYGNQKVVKAVITRTPIWESLNRILYLVSKGKSLDAHDVYFHLSIIFVLEDGNLVLFEKNALINLELNNFPEINKETQFIEVPNVAQKNLTLNQIIENTRSCLGDDKFFKYRPFEENCQHAIIAILQANGLLTKELYNFTYQDMKTLIESVPSWTQKISKIVFDIANTLYYLKGGKKV